MKSNHIPAMPSLPPEGVEVNLVSKMLDADGCWRLLTDECAYVLKPVCDAQGSRVTQMPAVQRLRVSPCPWGSLYFEETVSGNFCSRADWLRLRVLEGTVKHTELESIRICAEFLTDGEATVIYLSELKPDCVASDEKEKTPGHEATHKIVLERIDAGVSELIEKKKRKQRKWYQVRGRAAAKWRKYPSDVIAMCRHAKKFIKSDKKGNIVRGTLKLAVNEAKGWWERNHQDPQVKRWISDDVSTATLERWIHNDWRKVR